MSVATQKMTIKTALSDDRVLSQIQRALPTHMTADRMARVATTALTRVPKLLDCTVESFMKCMMDLSAAGLEPDGGTSAPTLRSLTVKV